MKLSVKERLAVLALVSVLAVLILPMLPRAREAAHRASCQNNLKQLGLVMKMYAHESKSGTFPPLSPKPDNWMMDMAAVYPEYLTDLGVLICPNSPLGFPEEFTLRQTTRHPGSSVGERHPDCVTGKYYNYTGYTLTGDEPALALYLANHINPAAVRRMADLKLPIPRWENSDWRPNQGGITVLWDRIPLDPAMMPHIPNMINVLCMDGSVRAVKYSPMNHAENFPVTEIAAVTFGLDAPEPDPDCY